MDSLEAESVSGVTLSPRRVTDSDIAPGRPFLDSEAQPFDKTQ
jgi:hypothetical protein